jgi:hypothetical protein
MTYVIAIEQDLGGVQCRAGQVLGGLLDTLVSTLDPLRMVWAGCMHDRHYFSTFNSPNLNSEPILQTGNDLCIKRVGFIIRK